MDKDAKIEQAILNVYKKIAERDPYIMEVSSARLNIDGIRLKSYKCCSACYSVIEQPWDHAEWCELYKDEELSAWIKKGENEK